MVRKLSGTSIPGSVFLIGLLIVAAIDLSYISINIGPFGNPDTVRSVTLHQEYYTMDNALGLARLYLDAGLRYSLYQAMYDNAYNGGFSSIPGETLYNGEVHWYLNKDIYPSEDALLDALEGPALTGLGRYTESDYVFLDSYEVILPDYSVIEASKAPAGETLVKAPTGKTIWIMRVMQNLDVINLEKDASLEENFGTAYLELYQKALLKLEEIKEKFGEAKAELEKVKSGTVTKEQEGSQPQITEDEVFLKALEDAGITGAVSKQDGEEKLKTKLEEILNELKDQAGETTVKFEREVAVSLSQSNCGTPQESQRTEGDKIFYSVTLTCSFEYSYDLTVDVSVTDNSGKKYPVNNRKDEISLEPLTMAFAAREGSDEYPVEPAEPAPAPSVKVCEASGLECTDCPQGGPGAEDSCIRGELCCGLERSEEPVCCNPDTSSCGTLGILASIFGEKANVCDISKCEDPTPTKCTYSGKTICCKEDEVCGYQTKLFVKIPTCVKDVQECGADETDWGKPKEGKLCCKNGMEDPRSYKGVYYCLTIACGSGELCEGTGQAEGRMNKCCAPGTTCLHHPNGYPRCV